MIDAWSRWQRLPAEMTKKRKWVVWRDYAGRKVPCQINGRPARTNTPTTWTDFSTAATYATKFSGIGFILDGSGIVCIDLDNSLFVSTGRAKAKAAQLIEAMESYTEISHSGKGLHIFGIANADIVQRIGNGKRKPGIEVYANARYIATTGNVFKGHGAMRDISQPLRNLLDAEFPVVPTQQRTAPTNSQTVQQFGEIGQLTASDLALIQKARIARSGARFTALFDRGERLHYKSQSEADMSLMGSLAFWTNGDSRAMIRIFSASALAKRDKWQANSARYIERTTARALQQWNGNGYRGSMSHPRY